MTTVTLDTLGNSSSIFIRDVIRENITDPKTQERNGALFVFKGQPQKLPVNYPFIILDMSNERQENITICNPLVINDGFSLHIEVWANTIYDRDVLSDQIVSILRTETSHDHDNESLLDKHIIFKTAIKSNHDVFKTATELVRIKFIDVDFQYIGRV